MSVNGFFAPNSISGSYVSNKRDRYGSLLYDSAMDDIGIGKNAAIQDLKDQYDDVVNTAYGAYLESQRSISSSLMGTGYKEAYLEKQREALSATIAEQNNSFGKVVSDIESQAASSQNSVNEAKKLETENFDRLISYLGKYREYLKGVYSDTDSKSYWMSDENITPYEEYARLLQASPKVGYTDENGKAGQSFLEWLESNSDDSSYYASWRDWFYNKGGYNEFYSNIMKNRG